MYMIEMLQENKCFGIITHQQKSMLSIPFLTATEKILAHSLRRYITTYYLLY